MLTLFYQMKSQKSAIKFEEYYRDVIENMKFTSKEELAAKCRICLGEGFISMSSNNNTVFETLERLTNIDFYAHNTYPKHFCKICYKFIKAAILFRKTAKYAEEIMKQPVKEEDNIVEQSQDHHEYSDSSFNDKDSDHQSENLKHEVKKEKGRVKHADKVTCHICKKVINRSYYKEHVTMHDPDHKKYVCHICGKSFRLRCAYHNHSLRHRTDFPYRCQFCPYRGRYAELLKTHMRTHTGDYRYMCTECPARFLFKSNLNRHILKHKEPKFNCDACKRSFHTKLTLQRHFEADHLGIKNHVCCMCGKAFGYRKAMMKHQRHVHKREKQLFGRMPAYLQAQSDNQDMRQ